MLTLLLFRFNYWLHYYFYKEVFVIKRNCSRLYLSVSTSPGKFMKIRRPYAFGLPFAFYPSEDDYSPLQLGWPDSYRPHFLFQKIHPNCQRSVPTDDNVPKRWSFPSVAFRYCFVAGSERVTTPFLNSLQHLFDDFFKKSDVTPHHFEFLALKFRAAA
jgi:hypothetical protein